MAVTSAVVVPLVGISQTRLEKRSTISSRAPYSSLDEKGRCVTKSSAYSVPFRRGAARLCRVLAVLDGFSCFVGILCRLLENLVCRCVYVASRRFVEFHISIGSCPDAWR